MKKSNANFFDQESTPLAYSSGGANLDFVKHKIANADPDLVAGYMCDLLAKDAPLIGLEKSLVITGAAQTLTYDAPLVNDNNMATPPSLVGVELAIQLNNLSIPNTDFKFTVEFLDMLGNTLDAMTQEVSGTASVMNDNTRQYLRFLCFQRFGSFTDGGAITFMDGRSVLFPKFVAPDPVQLAALLAIVPAAVLKGTMPGLRESVSQIKVSIPAAAITAGVTVTLTPIITGRQQVIEQIILALDEVGSANVAPADKSDSATKMIS